MSMSLTFELGDSSKITVSSTTRVGQVHRVSRGNEDKQYFKIDVECFLINDWDFDI